MRGFERLGTLSSVMLGMQDAQNNISQRRRLRLMGERVPPSPPPATTEVDGLLSG